MVDRGEVLDFVRHYTFKLRKRPSKEGRHIGLIVEVYESRIRLTNALKQAPINKVYKPAVRGFFEAAEKLVRRNERVTRWRTGWNVAFALRRTDRASNVPKEIICIHPFSAGEPVDLVLDQIEGLFGIEGQPFTNG